MKQFLLLIGLSFLTTAAGAKTASAPTAPLDTIAGHLHLVRRVSNSLCTQLTNDHTTAFDKLTPAAAMQLTKELFTNALQKDSVALMALMAEASKAGLGSQQVGQQLGQDAIVELSKQCPAALPLLVKLGQSEQVQQVAATRAANIGELEKKALQPMVSSICTQFAASNAKTPLLQLAPAQRRQLAEQLFEKAFATNRTSLLRYYSAAQLGDSQSRRAIGEKIAYLMMQQPACAQHLILLGADELSKQAADKQAATPTN